MKKTKTQKGITLVALIITIVVLLILAVVTIGAVQDSNIIAHAQNAASMYNTKKAEEEGKLVQYESEIEKILAKDRVYRLPVGDAYIKVTKDNKVSIGSSSGEQDPYKFEYVLVTEEIITIVNGYGVSIPDSVIDSKRALKVEVGEDEFIYLLLSKDEKILYCDGDEFILDGEINKNPKVYTLSDSTYTWHFIEVTEKYGVLVLKQNGVLNGEPNVTKTVESSDIFAVENTPFSGTPTNTSNITYSRVSYKSPFGLIYNEEQNIWIMLSGEITGNGLNNPVINSEKALTLDTSMSEEEINSYISSAN